MSVKKWVQHISGQGEKWEVGDLEHNYPHLWRVIDHQDKDRGGGCAWIPKFEYILYDPPKEWWEDVTGTVEESTTPGNYRCGHIDIIGVAGAGKDYRLTKMLLEHGPTATQRWAFIVERRKS